MREGPRRGFVAVAATFIGLSMVVVGCLTTGPNGSPQLVLPSGLDLPTADPNDTFDYGGPPEGQPAPTGFTGNFTWKWEGGDPNSIDGEHHEVFRMTVRLAIDDEYVGPLSGQARYHDAGSTWEYSGSWTIVADQPGCKLTTEREGHDNGDFADETIGAILAAEDDGRQWGVELYADVGSINGEERMTYEGSQCLNQRQVEPTEFGEPGLWCDPLRTSSWAPWRWDTDRGVTYSCQAPTHVSENGELTAS